MKTFFSIFALSTVAGLALADPKVAPDFAGHAPQEKMNVIVQFTHPPTPADINNAKGNGNVTHTFGRIKAIAMTLPVAAITGLAHNPAVAYISPDRTSHGALDITTQTVNANLAWSLGYDGTGVGVAVIDSGIAPHDDIKTANGLSSRVVYSESFVPGLDASDQYGHGTHVAGIVGSNAKDSTGLSFKRSFKGVAPNVNLINLRVLDSTGSGTESGVIAAIERAIALKSTYNIRVINLSLGRPVFESYSLDPLCQAAEAAWQAGIVVVTAAGNFGRANDRGTKGYGTIVSPCNDPYVITVGAMNAVGTPSPLDDKIASYSSKGPTSFDHFVKPDLVAPGNNVVSLLSPGSTLATNYPKLLINNATYETLGASGKSGNYLTLSGTSMATPVVAGAAALLIQKNPSLTPDQVKARLMKTARKAVPQYSTGIDAFTGISYPSQGDIFTIGAGYLDIQGALANNDLSTLPAVSPQVVYNSATHTVSFIRNFSLVWGDSLVWDDSLVWGDFVFKGRLNGLSLVWGASLVWGESTVAGFSLVWDDSVLSSAGIQPLDSDDYDQ